MCDSVDLTDIGVSISIVWKTIDNMKTYFLLIQTIFGFAMTLPILKHEFSLKFVLHCIPQQMKCVIHIYRFLEFPLPKFQNFLFDYSDLFSLQTEPIITYRNPTSTYFSGRCVNCLAIPSLSPFSIPGDSTCMNQFTDGSYFFLKHEKTISKQNSQVIVYYQQKKNNPIKWAEIQLPFDVQVFRLDKQWLWIRSEIGKLDYILDISKKQIQLLESCFDSTKIFIQVKIDCLTCTKIPTFGLKINKEWFLLRFIEKESKWRLESHKPKNPDCRSLLYCPVKDKIISYPPLNLQLLSA